MGRKAEFPRHVDYNALLMLFSPLVDSHVSTRAAGSTKKMCHDESKGGKQDEGQGGSDVRRSSSRRGRFVARSRFAGKPAQKLPTVHGCSISYASCLFGGEVRTFLSSSVDSVANEPACAAVEPNRNGTRKMG